MSERTVTITNSGNGGVTYHPERDVTVVWGPHRAKRCNPDTTVVEGEVNWYGDTVTETYTAVEEW